MTGMVYVQYLQWAEIVRGGGLKDFLVNILGRFPKPKSGGHCSVNCVGFLLASFFDKFAGKLCRSTQVTASNNQVLASSI